MKRRLYDIYERHTGQDPAVVEKTLDRDSYMSAQEAADFGIIDKVYERRTESEG